MNCAKCGLDLPPGVRQCPKCGLVNEFAPQAPPKKVKPIVFVIAALALLAIVAIAVAGMMASRAKPTITQAPSGNLPPGNVTAAPPGHPAPDNITSAPPGAPAPPSTTPPGVAKPKPPHAVVDYLDFVKKVEEHRQMLVEDRENIKRSLAEVTFDAAEGDPLAGTKRELERQSKNWQSLIEFFDKRSAPDAARAFSGAYRHVLELDVNAAASISDAVEKLDLTNPQAKSPLASKRKARQQGAALQQPIDQSADRADAELSRLVGQYDMTKPFSVEREEELGGTITGF